MKNLLSLLMCGLLLLGCSDKYDDSALRNDLNDLKSRVAKLEELCKQMNTNISSLQEIVKALKERESITNVSSLSDDSGYSITFTSGKTITIYHGKNGSDGSDGTNGVTPTISVKQDTDGIYYWTVNGNWLIVDGKKVKAIGTDGADGSDGNDGTDGTNPQLNKQDSVSKDYMVKDTYDLVLANPPFKGTLNKENISESLSAITSTTKTELLFVALFIRLLRVGGRCACIVPDGVLFGSSKAHKNLRKELVENQYLEGVISMPSGVFKPYAGVSTAILIFTKTNAGGTEKVWFYDMKADGHSLDDKRQPIEENDIPDIIERFHHKDNEETRERTEQSFLVDKQEIADNDYDLSINKYKKIEYIPVEYPPTEEILAEIEQLNEQIAKETKELREMLAK